MYAQGALSADRDGRRSRARFGSVESSQSTFGVQADVTIMYVTIAVRLITWRRLILATSEFAMKPRG